MTLDFEELEGSPTLQILPTGTQATRLFRVAWDDWPALAERLTGGWQRVAGAFQWSEPMAFPGLANVVVDSLHVAPFDPGNPEGAEILSLSSGTNRYPAAGARLTVIYKSSQQPDPPGGEGMSQPNAPAGTVITFRSELNVTTVAVPGRAWHWVADANPKVPDDVNPGLIMPTGSYRVEWDRVASPPWGAIRALRGKVNVGAFFDAPAGTLLFLGAKAQRKYEFLRGVSLWTIDYAFEERAVPWNQFFRQEANSWNAIADAGDNPPYAEGDFSELFQFGG